jgi:hypothetical protein
VKKPTNDEPLLLSELQIIKHKPQNKEKHFIQPLGAEISRHQILPISRQTLKPSQLVKLVSNLRRIGHDVPALKNIEEKDFQPKALKASNELAQEALINELFTCMEETQVEAKLTPDNDKEEKVWQMMLIDFPASKMIEKKTRFQSKSPFWHKARLYRVTASSFYTIVNPRARSSAFKRFMGTKKFFSCKSVEHGNKFEDAAFRKFIDKFPQLLPGQIMDGHTIVGLLVNPSFPFCGASPDRLIKLNGELLLVEIKCPYHVYAKKKSLKQHIKDEKFYVSYDSDGNLCLKKEHAYYYQIQLQLVVANLRGAFFVMYVPPDDIVCLFIERDEEFLEEKMERLAEVFSEELLPEFAKQLFA